MTIHIHYANMRLARNIKHVYKLFWNTTDIIDFVLLYDKYMRQTWENSWAQSWESKGQIFNL